MRICKCGILDSSNICQKTFIPGSDDKHYSADDCNGTAPDGTRCMHSPACHEDINAGLTKRERYAMAAMQGAIAAGAMKCEWTTQNCQERARRYFRMADAMIAVGQEGGE